MRYYRVACCYLNAKSFWNFLTIAGFMLSNKEEY